MILVLSFLTLFKRSQTCFTTGNGPEVFTPCALKWVNPRNTAKDAIGQYTYLIGGSQSGRCQKGYTPSELNPLCAKYFKKIEELEYAIWERGTAIICNMIFRKKLKNNKTRPTISKVDKEFIKDFLIKGPDGIKNMNIRAAETLIFETGILYTCTYLS